MPTGYTADVVENKASFEEFLWRCTRAMGAFFYMRDESLNAKLRYPEPDTYYQKCLDEAKTALAEAEARTPEEWEKVYLDDIAVRGNSDIQIEKSTLAENKALSDMLAKVEAWVPPTSEHNGLKTFMIEQLKLSMSPPPSTSYLKKIPTLEQFRADCFASLSWDIQYYTDHVEKARKRHRETVEWIDKLMESVPVPKKMNAFKK